MEAAGRNRYCSGIWRKTSSSDVRTDDTNVYQLDRGYYDAGIVQDILM